MSSKRHLWSDSSANRTVGSSLIVRWGMGVFVLPSNLALFQRREMSTSWERGDNVLREIDSSGTKNFSETSSAVHLASTRYWLQQSPDKGWEIENSFLQNIRNQTHHILLCECVGLIRAKNRLPNSSIVARFLTRTWRVANRLATMMRDSATHTGKLCRMTWSTGDGW